MTDPFVDAVVKALDLDLPDEVRNLLINLSNERVGYLERLRLVQRVAVGEMDNLLNVESQSVADPLPSPSPQGDPENAAESSPNSKEEGSSDPETPEIGD